MKRVIGYIRVSTEEQAKGGISLDNQKAKITQYAQLKDLGPLEIIEDAGLSAKDLKRPGMQHLLQMAKDGEVDAVICFKLDRMFRNTKDALDVTARFKKQGIAFHSVQETIDTDSPMGEFFFTIMAAIADLERKRIAERVQEGFNRKKEKGMRCSRIVPLGFDDMDGFLKVNDLEQVLIRDIHTMRADGFTLARIAETLNTGNRLTKQGREWSPANVFHVLRKEAIC